MSTTEIFVVVGGLMFGYWIVSLLTAKKPPPDPAAPASWQTVLQLPPTAGPDDIRAAYRELISQYHPDKVASLGAELRALAEKKSSEINAAYREALRGRGEAP
ncbi:MAG: J domain-containing protein [Burkholderiaceae bacterium]